MAVNRSREYYIGGGELFIKPEGDSNFRYFGATQDFKINFNVDKIEHKSAEGELLVTDMEVVKEVKAEVSFITDDFQKDVLALAFGGEYVDKKQSSGSVTDQEFSGVIGGAVYELGYVKVSNVVVKYKDGDNDVEAVEDVDYSVDYEFGRIEIAKGGAIDGKDIKVSFDYASADLSYFTSLNNVSRIVSLEFISKPKKGKARKTIIHKVQLSLNGDYDLKTPDKFGSLNFKGKILKDETKPEGKQFVETIVVG